MMEPEIWERAAEDGIKQDEFYPVYDAFSAWFLCIEEDTLIGVILVNNDTSVSIKIHPYLRKQYRQRGREMMRAFYEWALEFADEKINKINVTIPDYQVKVINFAKKVGFKKEGLVRESYLKEGQLYGMQNLGITREEIGEYLDGRNS